MTSVRSPLISALKNALALGLLLLGLGLSESHAAELRTFGQTIRSLGMGGVRIPDGDEATVLLWNPAGLAYMNGMRLDVFNLGLGTNSYQNYQEFADLGTINDLSDLDPFYGMPMNLGLNGYAAVGLPYFGFAVFDEGFVDMTLHNPSMPELNATYYNDYGYSIGSAFSAGAFSFGGALRRITRTGGNQIIGADILDGLDTSTLVDRFQNSGVGYALDAGMMFRAPAPMNPTISIGWQNIGRTQFQHTGGLEAPDGIRDNLTMGLSVNGDVGLAGFAAGMEYRHIGDATEQVGKKIHMGAEVRLLNLDARAGFYQGYTSYGVGMDLFLLRFDAAYYHAERGAYAGQTPDERIHVGLSMSFGFDPDFNLIDIKGKSRKLKQRR